MSGATAWHESLIGQLRDLVSGDAAVAALAVVGSGARDRLDAWSDLDALLVVERLAFDRFFPALAWLEPLGGVYAFEQHRGEFSAVTRICFEDLRRLDLIVTTAAALARHGEWPRVPFAGGSRVVFSRSTAVDATLARPLAPPPPQISDQEIADLANGFWFKGVVAVQEAVRGDLLVALHLSLELIQDCCVLAMLLRDRATGTTRHGNSGGQAVAELEPTRNPHTAAGILDTIEQCGLAFDRLAGQWSAAMTERRRPLLAWVAAAREELAAGEQREQATG
jgi:hypothetical protein